MDTIHRKSIQQKIEKWGECIVLIINTRAKEYGEAGRVGKVITNPKNSLMYYFDI